MTHQQSHVWRPLIEEVVVDGVVLEPEPGGELQLKSGARRFEFHYTSPNLLSPEQLRFLVRLVGLDKDWVDAGTLRVAYYHRLAPGNDEFQIRASGPGEAWQEAERTVRVQVSPRFYERRSAQAAGALALLAAAAGTAWGLERARSRRRP